MKFHTTDKIRLSISKAALITVFDECDGFDQDETGGRVIGTFEEHRGKLAIQVTGIIEAGPQARRSAVSFFQDGEFQERVFRKIDRKPSQPQRAILLCAPCNRQAQVLGAVGPLHREALRFPAR